MVALDLEIVEALLGVVLVLQGGHAPVETDLVAKLRQLFCVRAGVLHIVCVWVVELLLPQLQPAKPTNGTLRTETNE